MFESIQTTGDDSILGLIEKFKNDPNPEKVDLGVGVYRDAAGVTPIMRAVKLAEEQLLKTETTKTYTDSHGDPEFGRAAMAMAFGHDSAIIKQGRVAATQTPGGSAALRLAAGLVASEFPHKTAWLPTPTWPNHLALLSSAGLPLARYPYLDDREELDFDAMLAGLQQIPEGDVVLLHACCHNPTGYDLSNAQWHEVLAVIQQRHLLPLIDCAYLGLGDGLDEDAYGLRLLADNLDEMLVTFSCCKNFGIYAERTGCLFIIAGNSQILAEARSSVAAVARSLYSSPPGHGSSIVKTILASDTLYPIWRAELDAMRDRIKAMRSQLVTGLQDCGLGRQFDHILEQKGLFSYTGLSADQVEYLRRQHSVYLIASGRANIAGLTPDNVDYTCRAIAQAVAQACDPA